MLIKAKTGENKLLKILSLLYFSFDRLEISIITETR